MRLLVQVEVGERMGSWSEWWWGDRGKIRNVERRGGHKNRRHKIPKETAVRQVIGWLLLRNLAVDHGPLILYAILTSLISTPPLPHLTSHLLLSFSFPFLFSFYYCLTTCPRPTFERIFNHTPMHIYNFILIFLVFFKNIFSFLNFFYFLFKSNYTNIKNVENKAI